jgi:hypothetical protein
MNKTKLIKDLNFAQELLERMGLQGFQVIYKPLEFRWDYWHKHLTSFVIHDNIDQIETLNHRMENGYYSLSDPAEQFFGEKVEVINKILSLVNLPYTIENTVQCLEVFIGSEFLSDSFKEFLINEAKKPQV